MPLFVNIVWRGIKILNNGVYTVIYINAVHKSMFNEKKKKLLIYSNLIFWPSWKQKDVPILPVLYHQWQRKTSSSVEETGPQ